MTIGFLGSTKHRVIAPSGSMVDADKAFSDGFGRRPDFENLPDGKYGHLRGDATNLFNQRVELICATGGIPSAQAAAAAANNIPVLIIVGEVTGALSGQNIAGINLLTSKNIFASADFLRQQTGFRTDQIVLLVNTSSPAGHDEKVAWEAAGGKCLTYTPAGDNNENDIPTDIRPKLVAAQQNGAKGVVVSADPFFNSERVRLLQVVKQASLKGCYPFREYVKEANGDFYFGPSLYDAYKLLGTKAQQVLAMPSLARLQIRTSIGIVDAAPTSGQATGLQQIWNWLTGLVSR